MNNFKENEHPRDSDGKFTSSGSNEKVYPAERKRLKELGADIEVDNKKESAITHKDPTISMQWVDKSEVVEIGLNSEIQKALDKEKTPNGQRKIVFDYIMDNLRGQYPASDGRTVEISRVTAKKYTPQCN